MNVAENRNTRTQELEQRIAILEQVCAEAYQLAGAVGAPEKALDNLAAAAEGQTYSSRDLSAGVGGRLRRIRPRRHAPRHQTRGGLVPPRLMRLAP